MLDFCRPKANRIYIGFSTLVFGLLLFVSPAAFGTPPVKAICKGLQYADPLEYLSRTKRLKTPTKLVPLNAVDQAKLYNRAMFDMDQAVLKGDFLAKGSVPHIAEHQWLATEFADDIRRLGVDPEYYRLLATTHDMGKFLPDESVMKLAQQYQDAGRGNSFLLGRIAWHDTSTESYIFRTADELGINRRGSRGLFADIVGHNDGSGLPDVWWNKVAWPNQDYGLPKRLEGDVLTFFDRYGQGNRVGAEKIGRQLSGNQPFCSRTITEAYSTNPKNTIRQLDVIADRISDRSTTRLKTAANFRDFDSYQAAVGAQQETLDAFKRISWDGDAASVVGKNGEIYRAQDWTQFFSDEFQNAMWRR